MGVEDLYLFGKVLGAKAQAARFILGFGPAADTQNTMLAELQRSGRVWILHGVRSFRFRAPTRGGKQSESSAG